MDTVALGSGFRRPEPPPLPAPAPTDTQMVGLLKSLVTSVELLRLEVANQPAPQVTVAGSELDLSPVAEALSRLPAAKSVDYERLAAAIARVLPDKTEALLEAFTEGNKKLGGSFRAAALAGGGGSIGGPINVANDVSDRPARQLGRVTIDSTVVATDTNYDLTSDANNFYVGTAAQGSADAGPWTIKRIALTAGSPTQARFGSGAWSARAGLAYT